MTEANEKQSWSCKVGDEVVGPISSLELRRMVADGEIERTSLVWQQDISKAIPAGRVKGLFSNSRSSSVGTAEKLAASGAAMAGDAVRSARSHATEILQGVQSWDLKDELLPLNAANAERVVADPVFLCVTLLGILPLLIVTLREESHQILGLALFFAGMWAVIFRSFIVRPKKDNWALWIGSLFFTGVIGISGLLYLYDWIPGFIIDSPLSNNAASRLLGSILVTGLSEEICKSIPMVGYLLWKRSNADPAIALMTGIFSGLGFAAFENVVYADNSVVRTFRYATEAGTTGLVAGVQSAMIFTMLRSISLVFCHGVWAGIVAHFASSAVILKRHAVASYLIGITVASTLHGGYNWLQSIQPTFASLVVGLSFMLFYLYVIRRQDFEKIGVVDASY